MPNTPMTEAVNLRIPEGTMVRIDDVLNGGEVRSAFVRHAIEAEIQKREGMRYLSGQSTRADLIGLKDLMPG